MDKQDGGTNINIEEIMAEIRCDIEEKGYKNDDVNFFDIPCLHNPVRTDMSIEELLDRLDGTSLLTSYRSILRNSGAIGSLKALFKKVIRKLIFWYIEPLCEQQSEFNRTVTAAIGVMHRSLQGELQLATKMLSTTRRELNVTQRKLYDSGTFHKMTKPVSGNPKVSIIIPNKDQVEILKTCMETIDEKTTYNNYEIVIIENNSTEDGTFKFYEQLKGNDNISVIVYPDKGFNYQKIINFGVKNCSGDYILLLNNDTEIMTKDWIELLLSDAQDPEVGIVGAQMYYPDMTIQHSGGILIGTGGGTDHRFRHMKKDEFCDIEVRELEWVTAACAMSRRSVYEQVGYMDESYKVIYGDVDFCMKVKAVGLKVLFNPFVELIHNECTTRGVPDTPSMVQAEANEREKFRRKWSEQLLSEKSG